MYVIAKAIDRRTLRALESMARSYEPALRDAFLAAIRSARRQTTLDVLEQAMRSYDPAAAIREATGGLEYGGMRDTLADIVEASGAKATKALIPYTGTMIGSFDITNPYAAQYARTEVGLMIRSITQSTMEGIQNVIENAVVEGVPPRLAARQIRGMIGLTEQQTQWALNYESELLSQGDANIDEKVLNYADRLLRQRALTISRSECLTGDQTIDGAVIRAVFRRFYEGDVVDIITEGGGKLTTTPNHPMLTNRGWVAAGALNYRDYLISYDGDQDQSTPRDQDVKRTPPTIREVFDSLSAIGVFERRPTTHPDFHGDGLNGEVDVYSIDRPLSVGFIPALDQPVIKKFLSESDLARFSFCDLCGVVLPVNELTHLCWSPCYSRIIHDAFDYLTVAVEDFSDAFHSLTSRVFSNNGGIFNIMPEHWGFATATVEQFARFTKRTGMAFQNIEYPFSISTQSSGDGALRQTAGIKLKRLRSIRVRSFRGHVYNLSTDNGYFISNSFWTGNTLRAVNGGQQAAWNAAVDQGLLDASVEQMWIVTHDSRLCLRCSVLDGETAPLGGTWIDGDGYRVSKPPDHPRCRCTVALNL